MLTHDKHIPVGSTETTTPGQKSIRCHLDLPTRTSAILNAKADKTSIDE